MEKKTHHNAHMLIPVAVWEGARKVADPKETMTELVCRGLELVIEKRSRKRRRK